MLGASSPVPASPAAAQPSGLGASASDGILDALYNLAGDGLVDVCAAVPASPGGGRRADEGADTAAGIASPRARPSALAAYALQRTATVLPVLTKHWFHGLPRSNRAVFARFATLAIRPALCAREAAIIRRGETRGLWSDEELVMKPSISGGEVTATYIKDESRITMRIKFPEDYPLSNVEVECVSKLGLPEGKWRRWVLQIVQSVSMQDGSACDAVQRWKRNMDKEFDGIEPCPICYSVLHPKNAALPTLGCPTCKNKFHPLCLHTWFATSKKSKCVVCQQPFFEG